MDIAITEDDVATTTGAKFTDDTNIVFPSDVAFLDVSNNNHNNHDCNDNDDDDIDVDEDDNIKVIINTTKEEQAIQRLVTPAPEDYSSDIALQSEINNLIKKSININNRDTVTVMCQNQTLLIQNKTEISSRLASLIWGTPMMYQKNMPPSIENLNGFITQLQNNCSMHCSDAYCDGTNISETIGVFAATYQKCATHMSSDNLQKNRQCSNNNSGSSSNSSNSNNSSSTNNNNDVLKNKRYNIGLYRYYDFTLLILKDGKIIDYAIHGVRSNLNDLINEHNPRKIYCNVTTGDALDIFLNYEYQPFYSTMYGRMHKLKLSPLEIYNFLYFCERSNVFCSFCLALKYLCALIVAHPNTILEKVQNKNKTTTDYVKHKPRLSSAIVVPPPPPSSSSTTSLHKRRRYNMKNNELDQPHFNVRRINLKRAPKKQEHFSSKLFSNYQNRKHYHNNNNNNTTNNFRYRHHQQQYCKIKKFK